MNILRKNILVLLASQIATWAISLILLVLAPDRFGAGGFGRVQLSIAYIGFFGLVGALGSYQHVVKQVARDPDSIGSIVISALKLKMLLGAVLSVLAIVGARLIGYGDEEVTLIAIGSVGMVAGMLNEVVVAGLAGLERMGRTAFWQTVQVYAASIAGLVVLFTTQSTTLYVGAFSLAWLIPTIANYRMIRPFLRSARPAESGAWKALVLGGLPVFVLTVFNLTYSTIDVPLLESISGSEVVGWYTLAYRWIAMPIFITTIVVTAFLPQMSALAQAPENFAALRNKAVRLILLVNIPAATGLALVADDMIDLLYGAEYSPSIQIMRLLAPFVPLVGLNTVLATALVANDRHKRYLWVAGSAAVLKPPIALAAISWADRNWDHGAQGAAVVTVVTEIFVTACALRMRTRGSSDRFTLLFAFRICVAALAMVPAVLIVDRTGLFGKVIVGTLVYGAVSVALRTITPSTLRSGIAEIGAAKFRRPSPEVVDVGEDA